METMAREHRKEIPSIVEELENSPQEFEFHQAVKILEQIFIHSEPYGESDNPLNETVQIKANVSSALPSSDIYSLDINEYSQPVLNVNLFGIAGLQGPLPAVYGELIMERMRDRDYAFKSFLDIFTNRLAAISHRVRKKYWPTLNVISPPNTMLGDALCAIAGIKDVDVLSSTGINSHSLLAYAGLLWQNPKSAAGLASILSNYFGVTARVNPQHGIWLHLDESEYSVIGFTGRNNVLGRGLSIGTKVWDIQTTCEVILGPLKHEEFKKFIKNGDAYEELDRLVRFYLPDGYSYVLNLIMEKDGVHSTVLGKDGYLGWTSWVCHDNSEEDDSQVWLYRV